MIIVSPIPRKNTPCGKTPPCFSTFWNKGVFLLGIGLISELFCRTFVCQYFILRVSVDKSISRRSLRFPTLRLRCRDCRLVALLRQSAETMPNCVKVKYGEDFPILSEEEAARLSGGCPPLSAACNPRVGSQETCEPECARWALKYWSFQAVF